MDDNEGCCVGIIIAIVIWFLFSQHKQISDLNNQLQDSKTQAEYCQYNLTQANNEISHAHEQYDTDYQNENYTLYELRPFQSNSF